MSSRRASSVSQLLLLLLHLLTRLRGVRHLNVPNRVACSAFLGDAKSSLGDATSSLGVAKSSLGDAKSSLGDAKSSLGDAESSLGGR
jgi:hypothetical protein